MSNEVVITDELRAYGPLFDEVANEVRSLNAEMRSLADDTVKVRKRMIEILVAGGADEGELENLPLFDLLEMIELDLNCEHDRAIAAEEDLAEALDDLKKFERA